MGLFLWGFFCLRTEDRGQSTDIREHSSLSSLSAAISPLSSDSAAFCLLKKTRCSLISAKRAVWIRADAGSNPVA